MFRWGWVWWIVSSNSGIFPFTWMYSRRGRYMKWNKNNTVKTLQNFMISTIYKIFIVIFYFFFVEIFVYHVLFYIRSYIYNGRIWGLSKNNSNFGWKTNWLYEFHRIGSLWRRVSAQLYRTSTRLQNRNFFQ